MDKEMQYDATLGGNNELPPRVNLLRFTSLRAKEIETLRRALKTSTSTKLAFQRLPKHMRRRVMSHNAKRLPRRLREIHLHQLNKSGMPPKQKRPSRKYRRRPRNLLDDYTRRQRSIRWLETHIWHAKRFHMTKKWGHNLPDRPCDKAFRACYRATSAHCLVQDISYFNCIEIGGPTEILINNFKTICDCKTGLGIGAKAYIRGNREGQTVLFHNSCGVRKAIGTIYFHWKPECNSEIASMRNLWMWVHPSYYLETLNILIECFDLKIDKECEIYKNFNSKVYLTELKDKLNRFRLTGPLSLALLSNILKTPNVNCLNLSENCNWFKDHLKSAENVEIFTKQCEYWTAIGSHAAAEVSPATVLSLTVVDPRYNLPKRRTKAALKWDVTVARYIETVENAAFGPIWQSNIRDGVKENKISNAKLAEARSELLVPGSEVQFFEGVVPVMIIHRPGNRKVSLGYGSGWDLIVPGGWGNAFWMSLIMWGGRAGGLREFNSIRFQGGEVPFLAPDTLAGKEEEQGITETHRETFFKLPPNKRPNYAKFGVVEPFSLNWKPLVKEWSSSPLGDFFVLRDRSTLVKIQAMLLNKVQHNIASSNIDYEMSCIVPVRLKLQKKGTLKQFARIFLPAVNDLTTNQEPVEALKEDPNETTRKQLRLDHKTLLKQLRKQRIRAKQNGKVQTADMDELQKYRKMMNKLWLPERDQNISTSSSSRQIIGFVTSADFSFTEAQSCGVGYVAMGAIKALQLKSPKNKVLVRNIASRQYRIATLDIIV